MSLARFLRLSALVMAMGILSACEDPEAAAERYYQSALSLVEEGDIPRAMVELRNVFDNDGFHKEARQLYADLLVREGRTGEAYSQYLRLIEQYPDTVEVRRTLARLALDTGNWDEVERHGQAAIELAPDAPESQALTTVIDYREAVISGDRPEAAAAAERARTLVEADPDLATARRVLIDWLATGPDAAAALPQIDIALEQEPASRALNMMRLRILSEGDDKAVTEAQLKKMYDMFPGDEQIAGLMLSWYVTNDDLVAAEAFMREQAGPETGPVDKHMNVVRLVQQQRGPEAALEELARLAAANEGTDRGLGYEAEAALLRFAQGDRDTAVDRTREIAAAAQSTDRRLGAKMNLVRMQAAMGDEAAAYALVDEILAEDPRYAGALKVQATKLIRDNAYGEAVTALRTALDENPSDTEALLMLADAQQKAGNVELAQQQLAQAVDVSNAAARPSLTYAAFLIQQDLLPSAETVLINAFEANPDDLQVAAALARVLLQRDRLAEAGNLVADLQALGTPEAQQMGQSLQAAILVRQNRVDDSLAFLQSQIDEGDAGSREAMATTLQLLRLQIQSNRLDEARTTLDRLDEQFPDSLAVRILRADFQTLEGDTDDAVARYRALLEDAPDSIPVIERLYAVLVRDGQAGAAAELVRDSYARQPEERSLQLLEAGRLERDGDIAGAIAIYDAMYEDNSNDPVVANNLASLLSLYSETPADLERAYQISLRLTGIRNPAFQDTLGWIQLQRGNVTEAIQNLEAAVRGLPEEPTVAINLGLAYAEAGRADQARRELERGLDLAGDSDSAPVVRARERLAALDAPAE